MEHRAVESTGPYYGFMPGVANMPNGIIVCGIYRTTPSRTTRLVFEGGPPEGKERGFVQHAYASLRLGHA
jgi:hypothetical protein